MKAAKASKLSGIEAEIQAIENAEEAAARAAARSNPSGGGNGGGNWPNPTIPAHGSVVTYAKSRLGLPYVWAASGPRSFDCSGLTMWCYRQIGISLPHSSRAQINVGQRVSRANIQPGDLVFFGSPIHHVGMYVGGGMMIHSPNSGRRRQVLTGVPRRLRRGISPVSTPDSFFSKALADPAGAFVFRRNSR